MSDSPLWLGIATCAASASLIVCVVHLATVLDLPARTVTCAGWAVALCPTFVFFAPVLASENLQLPLLVLATALLLRRHLTKRSSYLGFALLGVVTLIRPESAVFVAVIGLLLVLRGVPIRRVAGLTVITLVVVVPWVVRNEVVVGRGAGISTTSGENFYFGHGQNGDYGGLPYVLTEINVEDELERSRLGWRLGLEELRAHPARILNDARRGTGGFFGRPTYALEYSTARTPGQGGPGFDRSISSATYHATNTILIAGYALLLATTAIGLVVLTLVPRRALLEVLALIVAAWFVAAVVFYAKSRFRLAAEPYMILISVWGLTTAPTALRRGIRTRHSTSPVD